jgi:hypothetical protein
MSGNSLWRQIFVMSNGILVVLFRLLLGHDLHEHRPLREIAALDGLVQVPAVVLAVHAVDLLRLLIRSGS